MKLPEEIEVEMSKYGIPEASVEAIVRDCAKTCSDYAEQCIDDYESGGAYGCERAILARYGLEPK